jgi:hypothetical protein
MLRLLLAVSLLLTSFVPRTASALSCVVTVGEREHVRQSFAGASAVFSAYVEEIYFGQLYGRNNVRMARLRVLQVWKGDLRPGDLVTSGADETTEFMSGGMAPEQRSAVLAYVHGNQPYTLGSCTRSAPLEAGTRDITLLNKLSKKREFQLGG